MDAKQLAAEVGCSVELAAECIAKRPGNPVAARALATLKTRKVAAVAEVVTSAQPAECSKGHPPAKMAGNLCPVCTARAARKSWAEE